MISNENKKIAQWAMEFALKNGCQACRVGISSGSNTSFDVRDDKLETLNQATENSLSLNLFVDGRYGSFSTNRIDKKELEAFLKNAIESTRFLAEDPYRQLPDKGLYYKGGLPDLQLYDPTINKITPEEKAKLAYATAAEIYKTDDRIVSVTGGYGDGEGFYYVFDSNGFEGESASSYFSVGSQVSVKGEGDARPESYWYDSSLTWDKLPKTDAGKKALARVLRKMGQKKIATGNYSMLVDNMVSSRLLSPLISAMYGSSIQQKRSFLIDKLGAKITSDKLTLVDDPHIIGAFGARYFDYEGIATQKRTLFDKGVLETYFIDTYISKKLNTPVTISGPSILCPELGTRNQEALIASMNKGILVTGFNGGNSSPVTGDFSFGVEGFLIENGKLTQPIAEMNITGNMVTLWNNLVELGNDPRTDSSWRVPTLLFEGVSFSGS